MENEDMVIQKEKQIVKKFESLFKLHGYNSYDSFDSKVWFIRNNSQIQTYIGSHSQNSNHNQTPDMMIYIDNKTKPKHKPKLLEIFSKCNHARINKDDFTQMNISVREFIDTISNTLADIYSSIKISEENIQKNDSLAKVAKITEIIHLLNNKMAGKSKIYFESKLIAVISSISNFQCGPYKAMLLINTDHNDNELIQDLFQEESLTLNALINVNQDYETILLNNSKKAKKSTYSFPQYSFGIFENDNNNLLVDKRVNGTSFSNLKLTLQGKNGRIESNVEYFLHLILTSIDELCDLTKEIWNKNCVLKMNDGKEDNKRKDSEKTVSADFIIELDDLTRVGILKRVKELISIPIDTKTQCLMDIDEILTDFFPEIKDSVMNILNREEENRSNCCAGCIII